MFGYLEHVRYVMYVCQEGFYNPIYFCLLRACSLCNVCVSGGVLQSEITFFWGATIRIFSSKKGDGVTTFRGFLRARTKKNPKKK